MVECVLSGVIVVDGCVLWSESGRLDGKGVSVKVEERKIRILEGRGLCSTFTAIIKSTGISILVNSRQLLSGCITAAAS